MASLARACSQLEQLDSGDESCVIDPKSLSEDACTTLDPTTLEWTDSVYPFCGRFNSVRGESGKRHWIVFDGDVDPEWAENLNSVLDDNKLLTLPSGERLAIPSNVRILFETETLRYATLATVSRCGMVWFSPGLLPMSAMLESGFAKLPAGVYKDVMVKHSELVEEVLRWTLDAGSDAFFVAGLLRLLLLVRMLFAFIIVGGKYQW